MLNFIKKYRNSLIQFGIITLIIVVVFYKFIFLNKPFFLSMDQQFQYNIFYEEWLRLIKRFLLYGEFPFYSWYKFLGSDFYSSANI